MTATQHNQTTPEDVFDQPSEMAHQHQHQHHQQQITSAGSKTGLIIVVAVCSLLIGGAGGYAIGHSKSSSANLPGSGQMGSFGSGSSSGQGGPGGRMGMMGGAMGTVTAISSDSITVEDQMNSESKTFSITSSTTVTEGGSTASLSDISTGDTVMVRTARSSSSSSSSSSVATSIVINPTMPSGSQGAGPSTDSTSST